VPRARRGGLPRELPGMASRGERRAAAELDGHGFLGLGQGPAAGLGRPCRRVGRGGAPAPLPDRPRVWAVAGGEGGGRLFRRSGLGSNSRRRAGAAVWNPCHGASSRSRENAPRHSGTAQLGRVKNGRRAHVESMQPARGEPRPTDASDDGRTFVAPRPAPPPGLPPRRIVRQRTTRRPRAGVLEATIRACSRAGPPAAGGGACPQPEAGPGGQREAARASGPRLTGDALGCPPSGRARHPPTGEAAPGIRSGVVPVRTPAGAARDVVAWATPDPPPRRQTRPLALAARGECETR
jgi:hypothetical protein